MSTGTYPNIETALRAMRVTATLAKGVNLANVFSTWDPDAPPDPMHPLRRWQLRVDLQETGPGPYCLGSTAEHRMADILEVQRVVRSEVNPLLLAANANYTVTLQDYRDLEFCAVGSRCAYDALILPEIVKGSMPTPPAPDAQELAKAKLEAAAYRKALLAVHAVFDTALSDVLRLYGSPAPTKGGKPSGAWRALDKAIREATSTATAALGAGSPS